MRSKLLADAANTKAVDGPALTALCDALAAATVEHIVAVGVVTIPPGVAVTVVVPAGTGATTAPGVGTIT
jgi:predicted transcriptional regulator